MLYEVITLQQTFRLSGRVHADDTTVAVLAARDADIINILTGPPLDKGVDKDFVDEFIKSSGKKIVCGSTTAEIAARELGQELKVREMSTSFHEPPRYEVCGIVV